MKIPNEYLENLDRDFPDEQHLQAWFYTIKPGFEKDNIYPRYVGIA